MTCWDTPFSDTIGLGTDIRRTGKNQAKMHRLPINNFRDLRLTFSSVQQQDHRTSVPHHYISASSVPQSYSHFSPPIFSIPSSPEFSPNVAFSGACILSHSVVYHLITFPFVGARESKLERATHALHH